LVEQSLLRDPALNDLLRDAVEAIRVAFGQAAELRVEPFLDPEVVGAVPRAYLVIRTRLSFAEAERKLDALDEGWWLANLHRASGRLSIALDYV
jgi:hypothetical protein